MHRLLLAAIICLAPCAAFAGTWRMDANLASVHTEAWARRSLNQVNPGLGVEYQVNRSWAYTAGFYKNSYSRRTMYALAEWTPLHLGAAQGWHVDAGLAGGLVSGYRRSEVPCEPFAAGAVVRLVAPSGVSLNLLGVPNTGPRSSGFVGFQFSVPMGW